MYDELGEDLVAGDVQQQQTTDGKLHCFGFFCAQLRLSLLHIFIVASSSSPSPSSSSFFPSWMDLCQMICHPAERTQPNPTKCIHRLSIIHWKKPIMTLLLLLLLFHPSTTQLSSTFHNFSPRVYNHGFQKKLILSSNQGSQKLDNKSNNRLAFEVFGRTKTDHSLIFEFFSPSKDQC
jgi:hypothetical protein